MQSFAFCNQYACFYWLLSVLFSLYKYWKVFYGVLHGCIDIYINEYCARKFIILTIV